MINNSRLGLYQTSFRNLYAAFKMQKLDTENAVHSLVTHERF